MWTATGLHPQPRPAPPTPGNVDTGQEAGWLSFADDIQLGKAEAVLNDGHESSDLSDGLTQPRINGEFYSGILQTYTCIERWL